MRDKKAWLSHETGRVLVPTVFESIKPKDLRIPIGFDRQPEPVIDVVRFVPEAEVRDWHKQVDSRRKKELF